MNNDSKITNQSVPGYLNKLATVTLLALLGLLLTPSVHAVIFTNTQNDEYDIQQSRVFSAKYAGGSNPCDGSWRCMTTYQSGQITNGTIVFQDGENIEFGAVNKSGVLISNKFFVPNNGKFIRKLVKLENPTGGNITLNNVYNLDRLIVPVLDTSSGDANATTADTWAVLEGDGSRPFYVTHWGDNPEGVASTWFYTYNNITIPAGETLYVLYFTAVENNLTTASNTAAELDSGSAFRQYEGLTPAELDNGVNFVNPLIRLIGSDLIAEQGGTVVHTLTIENDDVVAFNFAVTLENNPMWNTTSPAFGNNVFVAAGGSATFQVSVAVPDFANLFGNETDQAEIQISGGGFTRSANVVTDTALAQLTQGGFNFSDYRTAITADGGTVIFESFRDVLADGSNVDGTYEVFSIKADGTDLMQLTNNVLNSTLDGVNADGTQIIFRENNTLYSMDQTGGNKTQLGTSVALRAAIAADTNRVVFASSDDLLGNGDNDDGSLEIFIINSDGSSLEQLTDSGSQDMDNFSISDDGNVFAFESSSNLTAENGANDTVIYTMEMTSNLLAMVSRAGTDSFSPSVSGDGGFVAYASRDSGLTIDNDDESIEIFQVLAVGADRNRTQLTASLSDSYLPSLSYDGNRVLITSRGDLLKNGSNVDGTEEIFIVDVMNMSLLQLTQSNRDSTADFGVNITSDGERLVFSSFGNLTGDNPDLGEEIYIAFLDGRVFNNTVFTSGVSRLTSINFGDLVQEVIDNLLAGNEVNPLIDGGGSTTKSKSLGSVELQTTLFLFLFIVALRLMKGRK